MLDRVNSRDVVTKNVSFTCILPKDDISIVSVGNVLFDANEEAVGGISEIYQTTLITDTVGDTEEKYYRVTGLLLVEGYETKDGVFYTMGGQEMRINTTFSLGYGDNVYFYLDDIVENGQ